MYKETYNSTPIVSLSKSEVASNQLFVKIMWKDLQLYYISDCFLIVKRFIVIAIDYFGLNLFIFKHIHIRKNRLCI